MSWAGERKAEYLFGAIGVIAVCILIFILLLPKSAPSCFDGKQNQGEQGIDCGGPCARLCSDQYDAPQILWTRAVQLTTTGLYAALIYGENSNFGAAAAQVPYSVKIYDSNNILLSSSVGVTDIPASHIFTVFIDGINLHDKAPARIDFAFTSSPVWQKSSAPEQFITTTATALSGTSTRPVLAATIHNSSLSDLNNVESVAILYDTNGNTVSFSKTLTDTVPAGGDANLIFTWPQAFSSAVVKIEIVSHVLSSN